MYRHLIAFGLLTLMPIQGALACNFGRPWPSGAANFWMPSWVAGGGMAAEASAVERAFQIGNRNASNLSTSVVTTAWPIQPFTGDGISSVTFTSDSGQLCGSDGCNHTITDSGGVPLESDIYLNINRAWSTTMSASASLSYGGTARNLTNTVLHEIGHAMQLGHEADVYNIMGTDFEYGSVNANTIAPVMGADATSCLLAGYGAAVGYEDLLAAHWKRVGASGEYSDHARTQLLDALTEAPLPATWVGGTEPRYSVKKNKGYRVEYLLENAGAATHDIPITVYLSANSTIDRSDTVLWSGAATGFQSARQQLIDELVIMPGTMVRGRTYWLGVGIDPDNVIPEVDETNNFVRLVQVRLP